MFFSKLSHQIVKFNDDKKLRNYFVDSSLIANKYGYSPKLKKHKSTKISIICDENVNPIDVMCYQSNTHDSKIFMSQLNNIEKKNNVHLLNNKNVIIGNSAHHSSILNKKVADMKFGKLVAPFNKQNTKDSKKLNIHQLKIKNCSKKDI